ncbi:MAG: alpha/beta hydrolase-fold protein [Candidatus Omnitrophica bacterium]|nr:alpha/beta hydrolase-fold protein [Candidatus Omnitrophota bacterium]
MFQKHENLFIGVIFLSLFIFEGICQNLINVNQQNLHSNTLRNGLNKQSLKWDGLERTYLIYKPSLYNKNKPLPLVILLHGGGGTGTAMLNLTQGGFNKIAEREGFIVVYPDGIEKQWNDGREGMQYRAHKENIDDIGFISILIDNLANQLNIDKTRVYVAGISNGALMAHRIGCELSEKVTAIAMIAGAIPKNKTYSTIPKKLVPIIIINGTDDPLIPWKGGKIGFKSNIRYRGEVISTPDTVKFWIAINKCSSKPTITYEPDKDKNDGTIARKEVYISDENGAEVILYAIEGGGHTWPGGKQYLPEKIIGKTNRDIDANEIIWEFFKKQVNQKVEND